MKKSKGLNIFMFSIHGLVRADNMELGRDADTGGQVKYVVELGRHLAKMEDIETVSLFTRWISDPRVSRDYAKHVETVEDGFRIVRIRCGGSRYMRKELLWPHLDEYVDKTIKFIKREKMLPDVIHGHYADAGYVAMQLARIFGTPFLFTGHSLGRSKKKKLLADGMKASDIGKKYKINHRIEMEETVLRHADLVITSTKQEVRKQYGAYDNGSVPEYSVIPPGLDIEKFYPFYHDHLPESDKTEEAMYAQASMLQELDRFFIHPDKPLILALCRPDKRKNINGLVQAYGEDQALQAIANLAVFAGIRKDIADMEENERSVLTDMLLMMDKYDLYGKMAIPKKHDFEHEVPALYRITADKRGVFVNPALTEPFGITLLEAAATGVPIVTTNDGGPQDIIENCQNGRLVDPSDPTQIASAIKEIITENEKWDRFSKNGILNLRKHYTWIRHAEKYKEIITSLAAGEISAAMAPVKPKDAIGRRLAKLNFFIVTDIDNTLLDESNEALPELIEILSSHRDVMGFAVATGRTVESAAAVLKRHSVPPPDVVISSVGSEIYYGKGLQPGNGWASHIANQWQREKIVALLRPFDFLTEQEKEAQRKFKISYNMSPAKDRLEKIHETLSKNKCRYNLIYSHEKYLDILPYRASKGKAIRYLSYKWEIPLDHFLVCGDSGNDAEMLRGTPQGVVVANYSPELAPLKGARNVFFASRNAAAGILEAIEKYRFLKKARNNSQ